MNYTETEIRGAYLIENNYFEDERGKFGRILSTEFLENKLGMKKKIVQVNHSVTHKIGTFRGFHYQNKPFAETKIIKCLKGKIYDIFVDIRKNSPTFLKYQIIEMSEEDNKILYLPEGIAHGFQTAADNVELLYFHTEFYNPLFEAGINFNDPMLKLKLPLNITNISEKDRYFSFLSSNFLGI